MSDGLLTEEEVRSYLKVDSPALGQLVQRGKLTAYKIGGAFVRYRKDEVVALRSGRKFRLPDQIERSWFDRLKDFWSFYSIYILLSAFILLLAVYFLQA
ncbi:MAG: helix-turn-helix domain-containing protein [Candidatus Omnitrophica bacterium]|nr:helix-turn-helix domain-containing protein [Candidatus Omnitrophota bacterium]